MSPLPCSRTALDKLGKRLAVEGDISDDDRELLTKVLLAYDDVLAQAESRVREVVQVFAQAHDDMQLGLTTRVKTTPTIRQKLHREDSMGLKAMHDIAGIRITGDMTRREQDALSHAVTHAFAEEVRAPRQIDRRQTPSYGYRAVHIVVHPDGIPVEVQVRTLGQDTWAQVVERLGDAWGRGIRYGEPPPEADRIVIADLTRLQYLNAIMTWGDELAELEAGEQELEETQIELDQLAFDLQSIPRETDDDETTSDMMGRIQTLKDDVVARRLQRQQRRAEIQEMLQMLAKADWE